MAVCCTIEIEDAAFVPRKQYEFSVLPRIGEHVALEWDGEKYPKYTVYDILHVADEVEERPAFVVLYVRKANL